MYVIEVFLTPLLHPPAAMSPLSFCLDASHPPSRLGQAEAAELRQRLVNVEVVALCDVEGGSTDLERRLLVKQKALESSIAAYRVKWVVGVVLNAGD